MGKHLRQLAEQAAAAFVLGAGAPPIGAQLLDVAVWKAYVLVGGGAVASWASRRAIRWAQAVQLAEAGVQPPADHAG